MMHLFICSDFPNTTIPALVYRIDDERLERALHDALHDLGRDEARFVPMFNHCAVVTTVSNFVGFELDRLEVIGSILESAGYDDPFADLWLTMQLNPFWQEELEARHQMNQFAATMH